MRRMTHLHPTLDSMTPPDMSHTNTVLPCRIARAAKFSAANLIYMTNRIRYAQGHAGKFKFTEKSIKRAARVSNGKNADGSE